MLKILYLILVFNLFLFLSLKSPYYTHPLEVSNILKSKGFSKKYQIVGLFHDLLEDTNTTFEEIEKLTDSETAIAVKLLTKENVG